MKMLKHTSTRSCFCCTAIVLAVVGLQARAFAASAPATPIVVELFTSEGCSSCPPADSFLQALDSKQPVEGAQLIVLEEHVDYWDDQGWKDPFSSHDITLRQTVYSDRLHLKGPYTPQMVVDGSIEFVGSDAKKAQEAIDKTLTSPKIGVRISSLELSNGTVKGRLETDAIAGKADVLIAVLLEHAESQVQRGENSGHHLEHVAILRNLSRIGKASKGQPFSHDFSVPAKFNGQPLRVVALVQEPDEGKILGAAEARLPQ